MDGLGRGSQANRGVALCPEYVQSLCLCTGCVGRYGTELHELRGGLCRAHMEEEVYRDLEGPSTNASLKQNSSSGVGTDVEGKQSWRKWPGPSDLTLGEHGLDVLSTQ